jgi:hypothetical protein
MKKKLFSTLLVLTMLSCSYDGTVIDTQKIEVLNGILKFKDINHFEKVKDQIKNNSINIDVQNLVNSIDSYEKELKKELTDSEKKEIAINGGSHIYFLKDKNNEIEAIPHVMDKTMQKLLNKNGIILIGNDAIKYEYNKVITLKQFDINQTLEFGKYSNLNAVIKSEKNGKINGINSVLPGDDSRHNYFRNDLRLKVRYNYSGTGGALSYWNSIEIWGELQDRLFGIWWNRQADWISIYSNFRNGTGYNFIPNNNSAYTAGYNNSGYDYEFGKDNYHNFYATAECSENGGQYAGGVTVYR